MSNHAVEVVPVSLSPHPNADSLSVVQVWGYQVIVRTEDWAGVERGAYIPPDSIVPDTEQFAFLNGSRRIRARKLRGLWSLGMLVPAPAGAELGDDVKEELGIEHYEPPLRSAQGPNQEKGSSAAEPPEGFRPKYDVENMRRYSSLFVPGEEVVATEKIHGANGRWCFSGGQFHCGSRNQWVRDEPGSLWWRALRQYPSLMEYLRHAPDITAYGEVYGAVQDLRYGHGNGEISLALFDLWDSGEGIWIGYHSSGLACWLYQLPRVPELYRGPFDLAVLEALADGPTIAGNGAHHREGIVVKPLVERDDPLIGRVQLKLVSNRYLEKAA